MQNRKHCLSYKKVHLMPTMLPKVGKQRKLLENNVAVKAGLHSGNIPSTDNFSLSCGLPCTNH